MDIWAYTEKGPGKAENEDRIVVGKTVLTEGLHRFSLSDGILAVSDGVGGQAGGAYASQYIAQALAADEDISLSYLQQLNEKLLRFAEEKGYVYSTMAATLTAAKLSGGGLEISHVGNTRCWKLSSRGYLTQLTEDDTTVHFMISSGLLSAQEAERFINKNEIMACMGGGTPSLCKLKSYTAKAGKLLLLTCDGIHDHMDIDCMEELLNACGEEYSAAIRSIVRSARENGSEDDISIVLASV